MLEVLTGAGLASASGLNAFIPMLSLGLLSRFTDLVNLPAGWEWLENEWVLGIIAVLLVLELVADKIPAIDSINDVVQTVIRPTAGGIVFGAGTAAQTAAIQNPAEWWQSNAWVPVVIGVMTALVVHAGKAGTRAATNTVSVGAVAPVLSVGEDAMSVGLVFAAILIPVLVLVLLLALVLMFWWMWSTFRRMRDRLKARGTKSPDVPAAA
ncbi:DUF4126 domain-containing protein [Pseudoclavibacter alba]|uniref:DUF4126 domain-containing protein n=1 Tax=Pseudoclavibacter albus TaxID=272241 RepID=A0ABT2HUL1_9MICO|nr:DUF4126 domain-containing protein [Pseudoclavibacter alba]MCT2042010.1 DUF4126 domain-containing protein [Pseudoclavibacter alba]